MKPPPFPLMTRARRRAVQLVALGLWLTGCAWLILHYFGRVDGPFGREANPAEPWIMRAHGAFAFGSLFVFGLLWGLHVGPGWGRKRRRLSGAFLVAVVLALTASGYLLYYLGDETLRGWTSLTHWAIGLAALAAVLAHWKWRKRKTVR